MKVIVLSNCTDSLFRHRAPLIQAMRRAGHEVIVSAPEDDPDARRQFEADGIRFEPIPLQRYGMNPVADARLVAALVKLLRRHRPDRLFTYTIKPVIYGSIAARIAGMRREQLFSMVTGLGFAFTGDSLRKRLLTQPLRSLYRAALSRTDAVFFHNADDRDLFVGLGIVRPPTRAIVTNGSGVDLDKFSDAPPVLRPLTFVLASRLLQGKGIEHFIAAATAIKARHQDVRFRVLGREGFGPQALSVADVARWKSEGVVEFDVVEDIRPELREASVFVLPSYHEGTPLAILEAMAMARPIITTDAPGCRETVRAEQNGILVPVGDAGALELAMERFILDPPLIAWMGRNSRVLATTKYDVKKVVAHVLSEMGLGRPEIQASVRVA